MAHAYPSEVLMARQSDRHLVRAALAGGLCAGTLDIMGAFIVYGFRGASPIRILQSIASGVLGAAAFQGSTRTAALGLALHFLIATAAALTYAVASLRLAGLIRRPVLYGGLYGIAVYLFMNFVVVPLSAVAKRPFSPGMALVILGVHVVCVGIPIALAARHFLTPVPDGTVRE
jgi:hypothetical protein